MYPLSQRRYALTPSQRHRFETLMSWGLPPLVIPTLRWFLDPPEIREKLFVRDLTTYSLGTVVFFGFRALTRQILQPRNLPEEWTRLTSSTLGLTANLLFAGIGAVKLSQWIEGVLGLSPKNPTKLRASQSGGDSTGTSQFAPQSSQVVPRGFFRAFTRTSG